MRTQQKDDQSDSLPPNSADPLADDDDEVGELHATPAPLLGTSDVTQLLKLVESPLG